MSETMKSRKDLLAAAAAGAVAVAAAGRGSEAAAANGAALTLGQANTATSKTELDTSGTIANDGAFVVSAPNASYAIKGDSSTGYGVYGNGAAGVVGTGGVGGVFSGTNAAINLDPLPSSGAPTGAAFKGDIALDASLTLWLCVASGTPGTWVNLAGGTSKLLSQPQRAYDSRSGGGIFQPGESRTIPIVGANIGVPADAAGIVCNLTVTETAAVGFLTAWPGGSRPTTSNLNWSTGGTTIANAATVRLGGSGSINVYVENSRAHVIIDVAGYLV
jgi:hypothetical protein